MKAFSPRCLKSKRKRDILYPAIMELDLHLLCGTGSHPGVVLETIYFFIYR
jgi:hypothetical protein